MSWPLHTDSFIDAVLVEGLEEGYDVRRIGELQTEIIGECIDAGLPDLASAFEGSDGRQLITHRLKQRPDLVTPIGEDAWKFVSRKTQKSPLAG